MPNFHLLASSLLLSASALATAQKPAAPLNLTEKPASTLILTNPHAYGPNSFQLSLPTKELQALASPQKPSTATGEHSLLAQPASTKRDHPLLAQDDAPCYKLNVYAFTPKDLKSPHPHSSSQTDCTPASAAHLRPLQLRATPDPK